MTKILVVEDDTTLNEGIVLGIGKTTYHFTQCYTLTEAMQSSGADVDSKRLGNERGHGFEKIPQEDHELSDRLVSQTELLESLYNR